MEPIKLPEYLSPEMTIPPEGTVKKDAIQANKLVEWIAEQYRDTRAYLCRHSLI